MDKLSKNQRKITKQLIPAINFHMIKSCNMSCKYCFAHFNACTKINLSLSDCKSIIMSIHKKGFEKITFSGGEPLLIPYLPALIRFSKELGLTTMLITNGSLLTDKHLLDLYGSLDWIGISIDSLNESTNRKIGRQYNGEVVDYRQLVAKIKNYSYRLKINTVVSSYNCAESEMGAFIREIKPDRWKVMKALEIEGENVCNSELYSVVDAEFGDYVMNNGVDGDNMVVEWNSDMKGTYAMISPDGRFFTNSDGDIRYGSSIIEEGIEKGYEEMSYSYSGFENRGGIYKWR